MMWNESASCETNDVYVYILADAFTRWRELT